MQSFNREYQLPQAYQYFENVRNFLVALQQLRLPGFEASDLEKVTKFFFLCFDSFECVCVLIIEVCFENRIILSLDR